MQRFVLTDNIICSWKQTQYMFIKNDKVYSMGKDGTVRQPRTLQPKDLFFNVQNGIMKIIEDDPKTIFETEFVFEEI